MADWTVLISVHIDVCTNFSEVITSEVSRILSSQILLIDAMVEHQI